MQEEYLAGEDAFSTQIVVKDILIAIEDIDVNRPPNAADAPVGAQLPIHQMHIGFIFAVTGYPYVVVFLDVGSQREVAIDKKLTNIKYRTHTDTAFHYLHPRAYAGKKYRCAPHLFYLSRCGFDVEHRWKVAL